MDDQELFRQALALWGEEAQIDMMIEEMAELTHALCKLKRVERDGSVPLQGDPGYTNVMVMVVEEIADVILMIEQMRIIFDPEAIEAMRRYKINRLEELVSREG